MKRSDIDYLSETEAEVKYKRKMEAGEYRITTEWKGGCFNPKLRAFNSEPLFIGTRLVVIVEDAYFQHGNGD